MLSKCFQSGLLHICCMLERVKKTEITLKCMYLYNLKLEKSFVFLLSIRTSFLCSIHFLMWMTYETSEALKLKHTERKLKLLLLNNFSFFQSMLLYLILNVIVYRLYYSYISHIQQICSNPLKTSWKEKLKNSIKLSIIIEMS